MSRIILSLTLLFPLLAQAAPSYKVEMIFFRNTDEQAFYSEHWPLHEGLQGDGGRTADAPPPFPLLPPGDLDLADVRRKLDASPRYEVLAHLAWVQPGLDAKHARPMPVGAGRDFSLEFPERMASRWETDEQGNMIEIPGPTSLSELEGAVRLVLGRYLHVHTDLVLRRPVIVEQLDEQTQQITESRVLFDIPIRSHRRMRSRELHYLDHPLLGILVQVTPVEQSNP